MPNTVRNLNIFHRQQYLVTFILKFTGTTAEELVRAVGTNMQDTLGKQTIRSKHAILVKHPGEHLIALINLRELYWR